MYINNIVKESKEKKTCHLAAKELLQSNRKFMFS